MALRAKKPEKKEKRLKMFIYGDAGVGKTTAAIQFPNAYIIDTEHGTDFYAATIAKNGSVVFNSTESDEIKKELKALLSEKHSYTTLIIDPITQVYLAVQQKWNMIFEKDNLEKSNKYANAKVNNLQDWGMRYWSKVKSDFKEIHNLLLRLDMNIIITAHQKDLYDTTGNSLKKIGTTFDSMKGDNYVFDYVFNLTKEKNIRKAIKIKERAEIDGSKFPDSFQWSYENFNKFYGSKELEREANPIELATHEQVTNLHHLIDVLNVSHETTVKWLNKANADTFEEMDKQTIQKCIDHLTTKIKLTTKEE